MTRAVLVEQHKPKLPWRRQERKRLGTFPTNFAVKESRKLWQSGCGVKEWLLKCKRYQSRKYTDGNEPGEKKVMKEGRESSSCRSKVMRMRVGGIPGQAEGWPLIRTEILLWEAGRQAESLRSFGTQQIWQGEMRKSSYWIASIFSRTYEELEVKEQRGVQEA